VNYDNSLVVTITVTCYLWAPSSADHLFVCGAIFRPPSQAWNHCNACPCRWDWSVTDATVNYAEYVPNLSCDYFSQSCSPKGKRISAVIL